MSEQNVNVERKKFHDRMDELLKEMDDLVKEYSREHMQHDPSKRSYWLDALYVKRHKAKTIRVDFEVVDPESALIPLTFMQLNSKEFIPGLRCKKIHK